MGFFDLSMPTVTFEDPAVFEGYSKDITGAVGDDGGATVHCAVGNENG